MFSFVLYFTLWIALFTVLYYTLQVEVSDSSYPEVNELVKLLLQTFSNSVGNISFPRYDRWIAGIDDLPLHEHNEKKIVVFLIWMVWLSNQIINLIILLNFLIA